MKTALNEDVGEICYVGKAGKQLCDRWRQHEGGFKASKTGQNLAKQINAVICKGFKIEVWARRSEITEVFGVRVSRCQIEELALITLLGPCWNVQLHVIPGDNPGEVGLLEEA